MMTVKLMRRGALCVLTATLALHPAEDAAAQIGGGVFAYPTGGQDQQQQSKDQFECHQWSVQQSGFDPTVPQQQPQVAQQTAPPPDSSGGAVGGAAEVWNVDFARSAIDWARRNVELNDIGEERVRFVHPRTRR